MRAAKFFIAAWVVLGVGCMTGPTNGTTYNGDIIGAGFLFSGYTTAPGQPVELQVLASPGLDPSDDRNWQPLSTFPIVSRREATVINGDSLFPWEAPVVPVPSSAESARWPSGDLLTVRALVRSGSKTNHALTFDEATWLECAAAEYSAGAKGSVIGSRCNGLGGNLAAMVSTRENPADLRTREFLAVKGDVEARETDEYYEAIRVPSTLSAFRATYRYPGTGAITATYYNDGDLGIGREMHCWSFTLTSGRNGKACYVANYSDTAAFPKFGTNDVETTLNHAVDRSGAFATVAMVYERTTGPTARGTVHFMVYDAAGNRTNRAQLDNRGAHTSVPNNCLTCHGIDAQYNPGTNKIVGDAQFLPFDLSSFSYSSRPGFTREAQEESFRQLNALVRDTQPASAILGFINGSYQPSSVTAVGARFHDDFIPAAWQTEPVIENRALYLGVVKPYCRTCHISARLTRRDFAQASDFPALKGPIVARTCQTSDPGLFMPHAEHVMRRFWSSGARAYLSTWGGGTMGCKP